MIVIVLTTALSFLKFPALIIAFTLNSLYR